MTYDEIKAAWNAQADDGNRWHSLSEGEKIEWAAIHAAAKEREACAKACEGLEANRDWVPGSLWGNIRSEMAASIRARQ